MVFLLNESKNYKEIQLKTKIMHTKQDSNY